MAEAAAALRPGTELLPRVLRRWRDKLGSEYARSAIDAFVRKHRATLENMVERELVRRAEAGRKPTGVHAFAAYAGVVLRERGVDALPDEDVRDVAAAAMADASGLGLLVRWPTAAALKDDQWVQVQGTFVASQEPAWQLPVLVAQGVTPVDVPNQPYLYP